MPKENNRLPPERRSSGEVNYFFFGIIVTLDVQPDQILGFVFFVIFV